MVDAGERACAGKDTMIDLTEYKDQKVLVTGGAGAIGSNLCRKLLELGAHIVVVDNLSSGHEWLIPESPRLSFYARNINESEVYDSPDYIFHLAAHFANQNSVDHPRADLDVNGAGTLELLRAAADSRVKRFVYASSGCAITPDELYGDSVHENQYGLPSHLSTPYQIHKALGEMYCNYFHKQYGLSVVKARLFNSYGPGEVPGRYRNVIPNFIHWALRGLPLPITGNGTETRDWTYVDDIVDGILRCGLSEKADGMSINIASGREAQVNHVAEIINEFTMNKGGVSYTERRSWDSKTRLLASVDLAGEILGYKPTVNIGKGIARTLAWFHENHDVIEQSAKW